MNGLVQAQFDHMHSTSRELQTQAYFYLMDLTENPVEWAYEVWDGLVTDLRDPDNHVRAIAAQLLCNLAKSDPDQRIVRDFQTLLAVTKDERFVTARHCLQSLWKIGAAGKPQQELLLAGLTRRFEECMTEKNGALIRSDIIQGLKTLYGTVSDEPVRQTALALIDRETDPKLRKKYLSVWNKKASSGHSG